MPSAPPRVAIDPTALSRALDAHRGALGGRVEPCGLLLGAFEVGRVAVREIRVLENVHAQPDRAFLLPASGAVAAAREARERGLAVVGVWHGHLLGPAQLSESDLAGLSSAAKGPGTDGKPSETAYIFLVSGSGAGHATVVRAFGLFRGEPRDLALEAAEPGAKRS